MRKAETNTKLLVGTMAASLAGLGIVVAAATLSPRTECACTVAPDHVVTSPGLEPVEKIPSYHFADPPPPPPRPVVEDPRPMPPPSK